MFTTCCGAVSDKCTARWVCWVGADRNQLRRVVQQQSSALTEGYYTYEVSDNEATITDVDTSISGVVTIPSTLGGYSVTSIGGYAFQWCKSLTSVTIPDSVTSIGDATFYSCDSLTSVTIPDSVTSIGDYAFQWCKSLTSVIIGDSVTSIGNHAFYNCTSLTSVTITDSVTTIDYGALMNCDSLTNVTISDSVTTIGKWAFGGCVNLTDVYYKGTEEQWEKIDISSVNEELFNATIHYNYSDDTTQLPDQNAKYTIHTTHFCIST